MKQQNTEEQIFSNTQSKVITYSRYRAKIMEEIEDRKDKIAWLKNAKCRIIEKKHSNLLSSIWIGVLGALLSFALILTYHPLILCIILCAIGIYLYDTNVGNYYDTRLEVLNDLIKEQKSCKKYENVKEEKKEKIVESKISEPIVEEVKEEKETVEKTEEKMNEKATTEEDNEEMEEDEIDLTKMD